ncbi:MAG: OmpH family outer membrane protein [Bacteroidales bacterium]|jgi:outer membrane protein|nr:OmpH family outer membrane protein [Bacteroidales bacterium]
MNNLSKIAAILLFVVASATANAQTLKFGHIEFQALIPIMPEYAAAQTELEKFQQDLEEVLTELNEGYQQKLAEFEQLGTDVSDVRRTAKVTEIQEIGTRIENYRTSAYQQIEQKQTELLQPIIEKARVAIEEVAKAQSLVYVFDSGLLLYKSNSSIDVLPLVREKLGISQ